MDALNELRSRIMKLPEQEREVALNHLEKLYVPNSKTNPWIVHLSRLIKILQKHGV